MKEVIIEEEESVMNERGVEKENVWMRGKMSRRWTGKGNVGRGSG